MLGLQNLGFQVLERPLGRCVCKLFLWPETKEWLNQVVC